jgi:hypothetical protein
VAPLLGWWQIRQRETPKCQSLKAQFDAVARPIHAQASITRSTSHPQQTLQSASIRLCCPGVQSTFGKPSGCPSAHLPRRMQAKCKRWHQAGRADHWENRSLNALSASHRAVSTRARTHIQHMRTPSTATAAHRDQRHCRCLSPTVLPQLSRVFSLVHTASCSSAERMLCSRDAQDFVTAHRAIAGL